jgi:phosphoglycerol transferase MdoB-like AlkP superfamily enzyme
MMHSELYGACEGYNVVLFILESFSAEHSAYLMPEEHSNGGYTPNLDKLMAKGLVFDHCYSNGYVSIAAPPAIWSSTPSYEVSFLRMAESVADCRPLPRILADKGYHTAFFCGSEHGSMGFGAYAHIAGIDELYSMEDYEERHGSGDFDDAWGIWDEPFIDYMGEEISDFKEPFFASIFTLTSHHPFNVPEEVEEELPKGTTLNHRPIAYADRAIGRFMEKYRNKEWFQRTLFIFVADHVSSERMLEKTNSLPECFHIIGFMYTPDGAIPAQHYEHIFSHVDIMPTVLGLVGHDEPYFAIGRDIFNEPQREPFTLIRSGYQYLGLMDDYFIDFDGTECFGAYRYDDYEHSNDISSTIEIGRADSLTKATLQQYYMHVSQRDYFPKERR